MMSITPRYCCIFLGSSEWGTYRVNRTARSSGRTNHGTRQESRRSHLTHCEACPVSRLPVDITVRMANRFKTEGFNGKH